MVCSLKEVLLSIRLNVLCACDHNITALQAHLMILFEEGPIIRPLAYRRSDQSFGHIFLDAVTI